MKNISKIPITDKMSLMELRMNEGCSVIAKMVWKADLKVPASGIANQNSAIILKVLHAVLWSATL